jgi:hypothetical protein
MKASCSWSRGALPTAALICLWLNTGATARAHSGPPFPIVMEKATGPFVVSVWTHPDVGAGRFWILLRPPGAKLLPAVTTVEVWVQPADRRLPEQRYQAQRDDAGSQVQYFVEIPFETEELWRVRVVLHSPQGRGEVTAKVEVTPPGFGSWDLLIYGFPFLLFGLLWLCAALRRRDRQSVPGANPPRLPDGEAPPSSPDAEGAARPGQPLSNGSVR